jgi:spermidine/putrescine-binding protein
MTIDFFGRFQSESVRRPDGTSRMQYVTPAGGSSISVDPIGMLRGAPNPELALEFIEFVLSIEGQKLWNFKVGEPGGPELYALRRLPIRRELYAPEYHPYSSDPGVMPYEDAAKFNYHPEWTAPLFRSLSLIIRVMCLDTEPELKAAWHELIAAGFPTQATAVFEDVSAVDYATVSSTIRSAISSPDKIEQVRLAKELGDRFRANYSRAAQLAREGK